MWHYNEGFWAAGSTIAAWSALVLTIALNIIGLRLVWKQLKATESAANSAADAVKAAQWETRPWIKVDMREDQAEFAFIPTTSTLIASGAVIIENVGKTPAFDVRIEFTPLAERDGDLPEYSEVVTAFSSLGSVVFPGENLTKYIVRSTLVNTVPVGGNILVVVSYRATPKGEELFTPALWATNDFEHLTDQRQPHQVFSQLQERLVVS